MRTSYMICCISKEQCREDHNPEDRPDVHQFFGEANTAGKRKEWLRALDTIEALDPHTVIAGHKRAGTVDGMFNLHRTRQYILDFEDALAKATNWKEFMADIQKRSRLVQHDYLRFLTDCSCQKNSLALTVTDRRKVPVFKFQCVHKLHSFPDFIPVFFCKYSQCSGIGITSCGHNIFTCQTVKMLPVNEKNIISNQRVSLSPTKFLCKNVSMFEFSPSQIPLGIKRQPQSSFFKIYIYYLTLLFASFSRLVFAGGQTIRQSFFSSLKPFHLLPLFSAARTAAVVPAAATFFPLTSANGRLLKPEFGCLFNCSFLEHL